MRNYALIGAAIFLALAFWTISKIPEAARTVTLCGVVEDVGGAHGQPVKVTVAEDGGLLFRFSKPQQVRMVICPADTPFKDVASKVDGLKFPEGGL